MNLIKLKRALFCLYGVAAMQAISGMLAAFSILKLRIGLQSLSPLDWSSLVSTSELSILIPLVGWTVLMVAACLVSASKLKQQNAFAWIAALCIFLFSAFSLAFPFSALGILSLVDSEVRGTFLKELDVKI